MTIDAPQWFTSSYSNNGGNCVETAVNLVAAHGLVPVRDSKNPAGPALTVTAPAFTTFLQSLKNATLV